MTTNCTLNFECGSPLLRTYSGTVDIYSVDHHGYKTCDATQGKILASLKCGEHHANKAIRALDFIRKDVETYYFIGKLEFRTIILTQNRKAWTGKSQIFYILE